MIASALGLLVLIAAPDAPDVACPPQPLPVAIDVIPPLDKTNVITFSATPSLEYPGLVWVARLSRTGLRGPGAVEVFRLRRQTNCNRYTIEKSWQSAIPAQQFGAIWDASIMKGTPPADALSAHDPMKSLEEVGVDGTGLILQVKNVSWETRRRLHHSGRDGALLSSAFHRLVSQHVPPAELPSADWRVRRSKQPSVGH
jgi:hypothetical protein